MPEESATPRRSWAGPLWSGARYAAVNTPPDRDRVVDVLRSFSLLVVVFGHLLMAMVVWRHDIPHLDNLLAHVRTLQLATWVLQIMPIFFFAGSIANQISWSRASAKGVTWRTWTNDRLTRLIRPVVVYLAFWVPFVLISEATLGARVAAPLATLSTQLLWFLGVYLPVTAMTPWLDAWTTRHPWRTPLLMLLVAALCDWLRLSLGISLAGLVNFVVVWAMAGTLGLSVSKKSKSRRFYVAVAVGAIATNTVLIHFGPWPTSMVGMPGDKISNMAPPSLVLGIHVWVMVSLIVLLRPMIERAAQRLRIWTLACAIGGASMTMYLWHLTGLIGLVLLEHQLGFDRGTDVGTGRFWLLTALHLVTALIIIWVLITVFAPLEMRPLPWLDTPPTRGGKGSNVGVGVGIFLCAAAFLVLSATGMAYFPFGKVTTYAGLPLTPGLGFILLATGTVVTRYSSRSPQ
jgi:hypothetical protein